MNAKKLMLILAAIAAMTPCAWANDDLLTLDATPSQVKVLKKRFPKADGEHAHITIDGGKCKGCSIIEFSLPSGKLGFCDYMDGPGFAMIIKNCGTYFRHGIE